MTQPAPLLGHISDTARWVAVYRAVESDRPDALFRDPYAWRLAGDTGRAIAKGMGRSRIMAVAMAVRTQIIDEVIMDAVTRHGVGVVLNLAAGLDSRPYRLALPETLSWIEADLPGMIDHKTAILADEQPKCQLERVAIDLADRPARQALFQRVNAIGQPVLVLTEGLLVYLTDEQVGAMADDLHGMDQAACWVSDMVGPDILKSSSRTWSRNMAAGNMRLQFGPADASAFFAAHQWRTRDFYSMWEEGRRLHREFPGSWLFRLLQPFMPAAERERVRRMNGIIVLERD
jgi:methyltransferase (TIGR00027 family)